MSHRLCLERRYFDYAYCQAEFTPRDEALELLPQRHPGDIQKAAARLALEFLQKLTGVVWSDHTLHRVVDTLSEGVHVLLSTRPARPVSCAWSKASIWGREITCNTWARI